MTKQVDLKKVEKLFEMGAHLGHKKNRLHPKARKNVYQIINKTSIIDLTKTVEQLESAKKYLAELAKQGKNILVIGTKKTASAFVKDYCTTHLIPYVSSKWLPGTLTNFKTIMNNVKKLQDLKDIETAGEGNALVKHERTKIKKEIRKLEGLYAGIKLLKQKPDVLVIVDIKNESNAVKEAKEFGIPIVAIVDTNADPATVAYPVVSNDDDTQVVQYLLTEMLDQYRPVEPKPEIKKPE